MCWRHETEVRALRRNRCFSTDDPPCYASAVKAVNQDLLDDVARRLVGEFQPEAIWLFGSHTWGTPDAGSDVDLLVVVPESGEAPVERMRRTHRCLRGLGIAKDVLVKTRQEFDRMRALPSTLDHLVFHRGRRIYG